MKKKRYAVVGTGGRAVSFVRQMVTAYRDHCELVGLCDVSLVRLAHYNRLLSGEWGCREVPAYGAGQFGRMVSEQRPDIVLVTTVDSLHHDYIMRSLRMGCDVITEKPMTTGGPQCQAILDAVAKTGRSVRVLFNYRWQAFRTRLRELIVSGVIGRVKTVNMEYVLDTNHGADYFRRWHAHMDKSGGMLVHKATHHFDLVNWWIDSIPEQVFAYGKLFYYGRENALARGDREWTLYDRYTGASCKNDPFKLVLSDGGKLEHLYLDAESDSGYIRDRNVFRDDITITDAMSVNVRYRTGQLLTYSLVCFSPREGMRVTFNGDRGRIEYNEFRGTHIIRGQSDEELAREQEQGGDGGAEFIRVYPHFQSSYEVPVVRLPGGHGGADPVLAEQIFSPHAPPDRHGRAAGHEQGAASILVGIAANKSMETNAPVNVLDLVDLRPHAGALHELI
jgi:predicted dehydrogenase